MLLTLGQAAPAFTLNDQSGKPVSLADFRGKQHVVVFFYPKDETVVCTREVCAFRDAYSVFRDLGAAVLGVSSDSPISHAGFAQHHQLPFPLLSDPGAKLRTAYGVAKTFGLLPGRETFVIDKTGILRHRFCSQLHAQKHIDEALAILKTL